MHKLFGQVGYCHHSLISWKTKFCRSCIGPKDCEMNGKWTKEKLIDLKNINITFDRKPTKYPVHISIAKTPSSVFWFDGRFFFSPVRSHKIIDVEKSSNSISTIIYLNVIAYSYLQNNKFVNSGVLTDSCGLQCFRSQNTFILYVR